MRKSLFALCLALALPAQGILSPVSAEQAAKGTVEERLERVEKKMEDFDNIKSEHRGLLDELKGHVETLESELTMVDYRTGRIKALQEKAEAFSIGGDLSLIMQGATNTGSAGGDRAEGSYSADLFLTVPMGRFGNVFFRGDIGQGDGIAPNLPPTFSGPNADLEFNQPSFELVEAWYWTEIPIPDLKDRRLELTIGKMDPTAVFDANKAANSEFSQFMADIFVNNTSIEFGGDANGYGPGATIGYRFTSIYDKGKSVTGRIGFFEGDGDFTKMFDSPFLIAELDIWRPHYGLEGNYRFYAWVNKTGHADLLDPAKDGLSNKGAGFSIDQKVTDDVTLFTRYGIQDRKVSRFDQVFSVGAQLAGNAWKRGNDNIGVAYGASHVSKPYRQASLSLDGYEASAAFEHYIEAYYKYFVNNNISFSPDVQYIVNPGGDKEKDSVFIYGLRGSLSF